MSMLDLTQLIYLSSSDKLLSDKELHKILETARERNTQHNITGILLYNDGNFIQVIEGCSSDVKQLYQNISNDASHKGLIKLIEQHIEERDFPHWAMSFRDLSALGEKGFSSYMFDENIADDTQVVSEVKTLLMRFKKSHHL